MGNGFDTGYEAKIINSVTLQMGGGFILEEISRFQHWLGRRVRRWLWKVVSG